MNILYILGNGFDIAQGMRTSYPDFYNYLFKQGKESNPLFEKLKEEIKQDKINWSDMEKAFGLFTSKIETYEDLETLYFEYLCKYLREYLKSEEDKFVPSDELQEKFIEDLILPSKYLGETDKQSYDILRKRFSSPTYINIMTLNYTSTFEKLLSKWKWNGSNEIGLKNRSFIVQKINHVHGELKDSIIIGVDNISQIAKEEFRNNEDVEDILVKERSNLCMKFPRHQVCKNFIQSANLIVLFGVSLGDTDSMWWKLIGSEFKRRTDIILIEHVYTENNILETERQKLGRLERNRKNILFKKLDLEDKNIGNRLFFIINSKNFVL